MLEPITLGQGRTHTPGLAADERGVVMGRKLALLFGDIARTVGFFRTYSREVTLDEILPSLEIVETKNPRGGREIMVRFEVGGSYAADRAAQAGRMHKGRVFTGTDGHFVPYRDRRSPLGYDLSSADEVVAEPGELVLYGEAGPDQRTLARRIALRDLLLGLSPRPLTLAEREGEQNRALVVRCEQGLAREVSRYLWQRQVSSTVEPAATAQKSLFSQRQREIQLIRCESLPHHIASLLHATPGVKVFVPVEKHLLVAWGHRHPVALESCGAAFSDDEIVLFHAPPDKVERLHSGGEPVDIRDLVDVTIHGAEGVLAPPEQVVATPVEALSVELKLARLPRAAAATQALLVGLDRLPWFIKLIYLLPQAVLRTYEAVIADPYVIVVNRRGVHGIPFGDPMTELYPQLFVPVGMQLLPRVDYDLLRETLAINPDQNLYFFPEDGKPFSIPKDVLHPLSRAVVAEERAKTSMIELQTRDVLHGLDPATIAHDRQSLFSLWRGTRVERKPIVALEPATASQVPRLAAPPVVGPKPATSPEARSGPGQESIDGHDDAPTDPGMGP
jgi:hypothetical protein